MDVESGGITFSNIMKLKSKVTQKVADAPTAMKDSDRKGIKIRNSKCTLNLIFSKTQRAGPPHTVVNHCTMELFSMSMVYSLHSAVVSQ